MASDIASRDHYLTLALASRRTIEALRAFVRTGKRENRLEGALPAAIESRQAASGGRQLTGYGLRVRRSYDQVRTINELFPEKKDRLRMIKTLRAIQKRVTHDAQKGEVQKKAALEAINFFYRIENRALRNYRHPLPRAARTIRRSCLLAHQAT